MAVVRVTRKKGFAYRVRWKNEAGRWYSKTSARKSDADAYDAKVRLSKRKGDLDDLDAGKQRLRDFVAEWWRLDAEPRLAPKTLALYAGWRDKHILPRLGSVELRKITPALLQRFQTELLSQGTGAPTVRKTMVLLQGILERAVEWGKLTTNPARVVRKRRRGESGRSEP